MSWETSNEDNPLKDLTAACHYLAEEAQRAPRPRVVLYEDAVWLLRAFPNRRNRRMLVKLTLSLRRMRRRQAHPARRAREQRGTHA